MRRPLVVAHTGAPGGMGEVLLMLLELCPTGVSPAFVFLEPGPVEERARALGAPTATVPTGRGRDLRRWPGIVRTLRGAIRAHGADVVFAHHSKAQLYAGPAARLEGIPNAWWRHNLPGHEALLDAAVDRIPTDLVICSSERVAQLQRRASPRRRVVAVHPGTLVPSSPPSPVRTEGRTIGIVGRLQRWKRVELLLQAVPALLAAEPSAHVRVVGDAGPGIDEDYPDELRTLTESLGIGAAVEFAGHVAQAAERIADFDVLVHTAAEEPFGLVLIEAMAHGVPVIAAREGGPLEIVRDGVDGLLVDVTDPSALSHVIVELLRDPARRGRMAAAGYERVAAKFTEQRMADQTWELVAGLLPGPGR